MRIASLFQTFGLCLVAGPISGLLLHRAIIAGVQRNYYACVAWGAALGLFQIGCALLAWKIARAAL